jgi:hypothetical protein
VGKPHPYDTALPAAMRYALKAENYEYERDTEKNFIV